MKAIFLGLFISIFTPAIMADDCSPSDYFEMRPDVAKSGMTAFDHYRKHGNIEGMCRPNASTPSRFSTQTNGTCTTEEYFNKRPDVARSGLTANKHYLKHGFKEGMCSPINVASSGTSSGSSSSSGSGSGGSGGTTSGDGTSGGGTGGGPQVAPIPGPNGLILSDTLTDNKSKGIVSGGSFSSDGWKHVGGRDKIIWDLRQTMEEGTIQFEVKGFDKNKTRGGYLGQPGSERAYFFGLYNQSSGNKADKNNPAFIEIRYNWGNSYTKALKLQAGAAGLGNKSTEHFGNRAYQNWDPAETYLFQLGFAKGVVKLYIDGKLEATATYENKAVRFRYLFLGNVNYAGMTGPNDIHYRNVKVTKVR
jgi:hypothetical protein